METETDTMKTTIDGLEKDIARITAMQDEELPSAGMQDIFDATI